MVQGTLTLSSLPSANCGRQKFALFNMFSQRLQVHGNRRITAMRTNVFASSSGSSTNGLKNTFFLQFPVEL